MSTLLDAIKTALETKFKNDWFFVKHTTYVETEDYLLITVPAFDWYCNQQVISNVIKHAINSLRLSGVTVNALEAVVSKNTVKVLFTADTTKSVFSIKQHATVQQVPNNLPVKIGEQLNLRTVFETECNTHSKLTILDIKEMLTTTLHNSGAIALLRIARPGESTIVISGLKGKQLQVAQEVERFVTEHKLPVSFAQAGRNFYLTVKQHRLY